MVSDSDSMRYGPDPRILRSKDTAVYDRILSSSTGNDIPPDDILQYGHPGCIVLHIDRTRIDVPNVTIKD